MTGTEALSTVLLYFVVWILINRHKGWDDNEGGGDKDDWPDLPSDDWDWELAEETEEEKVI